MILKKRFILILLIFLAIGPLSAGCGKKEAGPINAEEKKLTVFTSFYPLYDFTRKIGGERVEVVNLLPPGAEAHDWEPGPQILGALYKGDLLIINGLGLEPWVERLAGSLEGKIKIINTSEGIRPLRGYTGHHHDDHDHGDDHNDDHGENNDDNSNIPDPHIWLDPLLALHQAERIAEALIALDTGNARIYSENLFLFRERAEALDKAYRDALSGIKGRYFIVTHLSFAYLAERYNLTQVGISGLSPHVEPSPAQMKELVDFARKQKIQYIFQEPLSSGKLANVLASELGAQVLFLNPLEGLTEQEQAANEDYFTVMDKNLSQLKKAFTE